MAFWITFLIYTAIFVATELLRPKPDLENAKPSNLGDFQLPTATEGRPVPIIWGTVMQKGANVVWYGNLEYRPITEYFKTGLFGGDRQTVGFRYHLGIQFALCRGPVDLLLRVVVDDDKELFSGELEHNETFSFDDPKLLGGDKVGQGGMRGAMRFFAGTDDQQPSSYLTATQAISAIVVDGGTGYLMGEKLELIGGTGEPAVFKVTALLSGSVTGVAMLFPGLYSERPESPVATDSNAFGTGCTLAPVYGGFQNFDGKEPAYRGTCYLAPDAEPIYVGNSPNLKPWKFEIQRVPNGLGLTFNRHLVNGFDANPANVLYEILTDSDWGLGKDPGTIDTTSFTDAGNTLAVEGNGVSYNLDTELDARELLRVVEEQIDGVVYFDQGEAKWKLGLVRADYDPDLIRELNDTNCTIENYSRGSWEETTNVVTVEFTDRTDEYKETYALAQDLANVRIQGGVTIKAAKRYPGVKDRTLANQLAWRDLRTLSYPLAKATVTVDRSLFDAIPTEVFALSDADLGIDRLPMRVQRVDYGSLLDGQIRIDLVQDIFYASAGSFSDPTETEWTPPGDVLAPFDTTDQLAFEAPRAFVMRAAGAAIDLVWSGARHKGPEIGFLIVERHAVGTPSGPFVEVGTCYGFLFIGSLANDLPAGSAKPLSSLLVDAGPDTQSAIESSFVDSPDVVGLGTTLGNLILIDDEFMIPQSAQTSGADVQLNNVYRGLLDSVQADHVAGTPVYLLFVGGALSERSIPAGNNVDVKLLPFTPTAEVEDTLAEAIVLSMDDRIRRPIAPSTLRLNGILWDATSVSLEGTGTGGEDFGAALAIRRRDFRIADRIGDEIGALDVDAADIFPDFPAANLTDHEIDVRNDPTGANTLLFTDTFASTTYTVLRLDVLIATDGVLPTELRVVIRARHTFDGVAYDSRQDLVWDFTVASGLTGQFNFGALDTGDVSNLYTATVSGTYAFTLSSAFSTGDVEYRINAGAWLTLISAGNTSGSILGVLASDTIEVRHGSTDVGARKFLAMNAAGIGQDAYAALFT